jgi:deoxyribose-phosphate aldolase
MNAAERVMAARVLAALDLTSLGEDDTPEAIERLCAAAAAGGHPAAVCVYPEHIATARRTLELEHASAVAVATVVNFPDGSNDISRALRETLRALAAGADEIDIVFPWRAWLGGDREGGALMLQRCKSICGGKILKVILETGELGDPLLIREVALAALGAGADFIKTSTGKTKTGATPAAARTMLECIRECGGRAGFKAAGGVRTLADAGRYLALADEILGAGWATPARFRIGASTLLAELRAVLA